MTPPVRLSQSSSSFSSRSMSSSRSVSGSRSVSSASALGLGLGGAGMMVLGGGGMQGRISAPFPSRAPSVYGGAGGYGTRISESSFTYGSGSLTSYGEAELIGNEKFTMQNLNDRLANYLEKVRSLESANSKLELQISNFFEKRTIVSREFSGFYATIADLQAKIAQRRLTNHSIILQMDNANLAAEDFKMKYEMELNMRTMVEADILRLRSVRDSMTLAISDLEMQVEGLKEELAYIKSNHLEEMRLARVQTKGNVIVDVDGPESLDLSKELQDMREYYETVMVKNKEQLEKWYQEKMKSIVIVTSTDVTTSSSELSELRRSYQTMEINLQSVVKEFQCLQQNLEEVKSRYSLQLSQLQLTINNREEEFQALRVSIEQQKSEYILLLDIKMRLELEIAEYRRLLEGEHYERKAVVISKVVEVEEHKPHIERRVKTIVEEIIDGKVVSSSVDTEVQEIQ